jgi:hypothetical protein
MGFSYPRMNKPVTFICTCIAGVGLLILGAYCYYGFAYGHGDMEAGNFHRCVYQSERDSTTGKTVKRWETDWERLEGTETSPLARIDMWFIGLGFVVLGAAIWVGERTGGRKSAI